jgi:hypothetical protein
MLEVVLPLFLALAVAAPASALDRPTCAALALADGRALPVPLRPDLVRYQFAAGQPATLSWQQIGDALVGSAADDTVSVIVRIAPGVGSGLDLEATFRYLATVEVEREAVQLRLAGPARALGRDLSLSALSAPLRVDRGTPVLLVTNDLVVVGGPGLTAARYAPSVDGGVDVALILDDQEAHPFAVYPQCLERLPRNDGGGGVQFAALERKLAMGRMVRRRGELVVGRATIYPLEARREALPLVVERWPGGASAALVFTDHADRTDPEALRALLHGDSRPVCAPPLHGFLGHGVKITKSFFLHDRRGGLDDPETAQLARELLDAGSEVAVHSITGEADDREAVRAALPRLAPFGVETWIDHQPYTNCEAISNQGWRSDGRYGIRDLLVDGGIRWIWEAGDLAGFAPEPRLVNLLAAVEPRLADPPVYPLPMDDRLWVFQTTRLYGPPDQLAAAISDEALGRLEEQRGLFVGHTYLSASARTTSQPEHLSRLTVRPTLDGYLELHPAIEAALRRIGDHVRAGTLVSLTWAEAGDRLRALGDLQLIYLPDGTALVENHGTRRLAGLTVAVLDGDLELAVEGASIAGRDRTARRSRIWFDLEPGARVRVRGERGQQCVSLLPVERAAAVLRPDRSKRTELQAARTGAAEVR